MYAHVLTAYGSVIPFSERVLGRTVAGTGGRTEAYPRCEDIRVRGVNGPSRYVPNNTGCAHAVKF